MGLEPSGQGLDDRDLPVAGPALGLFALEPGRAGVDLGEGGPHVEAPAGQVDVVDGQRKQLAQTQPGE